MLVRLLDKLFVNPINIPLRRFAFATHRCPPSKGDVGLAKAIGADVVFRPYRHPPAVLRLCQARVGDVDADAGVLRDLDAVGCRNIPLRPAAPSFARRGPPSKGESLDPCHAFYQHPPYITT